MTAQKIHIKICGMRDAANINAVIRLSPDYLGFIEYAASPRYVDGMDIIPLPSIARVGVFVNADVNHILTRAKGNYDVIQLHGQESVDAVSAIREAGLKVIKVFSVDDHFNFNVTKPYVNEVDYFLFDTKGKLHGGNARTFDWSILRHYDQEVPFLLSGGLTPENLAGLSELRHMNLHGVDLNSGVETSPGLKDIEKVTKAFEIIRKINNEQQSN